MRGCFQHLCGTVRRVWVLPAYAGMFPECFPQIPYRSCSPRVCGDVSSTENFYDLGSEFSPRMRGCFYCALPQGVILTVLPAYAGMFPIKSVLPPMPMSSPRVCGDVSSPLFTISSSLLFSPRMRGCFSSCEVFSALTSVLPAYAGMFPAASLAHRKTAVLPAYARGCFRVLSWCRRLLWVLPAYAGMFPVPSRINFPSGSSPRVCGDVSIA